MKSLSLLIFIFSLSISAFCAQPILIKGKVVGCNGQTLAQAHVQLAPIGHGIFPEKPIAFSQVNPDGSYDLSIEDEGSYMFIVSGVHHKAQFIYLLVESDETYKIDIQLGTYDESSGDYGYSVMGSFNDYDYGSKVGFSKSDEHAYEAKISTSTSETGLNLFGAVWGPAIAFPSEEYEWRRHSQIGTGGYIGIVQTPDDSISLSLDLSFLPPSNHKAIVKFDKTKLGKLQEIYQTSKDEEMAFYKAMNNHRTVNNNLDNFNYDFNPYFNKIEEQLNTARDQEIRNLLFISHGRMGRLTKDTLNPIVAQQAFKEIKPEDAVWGLDSYAMHSFLKSVGGLKRNPQLISYLESMVELQPLREGRATMLGVLVAHYLNEDSSKYESHFDRLLTDFGDTFAAKKVKRVSVKERNIEIGKKVPIYSVKNVLDTSNLVTNQDMDGKLYLIDIWATWCGPCINELPNMLKVYNKHHEKGFEILSVSLDQNIGALESFIREGKYAMPWISSYAEGEHDGPFAEKFEVIGIPKVVLVNKDGEIIAIGENLRGESLESTISKFLDE